MTSIDSVSFAREGYEYQGEETPGRVRIWLTPGGDALELYYFPAPPDLPRNAVSIDDFRAFYDEVLSGSNAKILEAALTTIDECRVYQMIVSVPQQPTGAVYVASVTVPRRDFSFVLKIQAAEFGATGQKEAVLLDRHLATHPEGGADAPDYDAVGNDAEFPHHPVARVRRTLRDIAQSLSIDAETKSAAPFPLPD
ncbi:MAG: hypothetical protein QGG36_22535 [Pirellulaceae bacterium]|jgi:hypothetical protein|nr:hypothetical protein [Pirellulaceae bacterium]MDP7018593.1 hypothetical protein [Pirellulaceae bacterium]